MLTVAPIAITMIISTFVTAIISMFVRATATLHLITRGIFSVVPVIPHKIDAFTAGVVPIAVSFPVPCLILRYAQIDRRTIHRYRHYYSGLSIDYLWLRIATNVELTIETRLANAG